MSALSYTFEDGTYDDVHVRCRNEGRRLRIRLGQSQVIGVDLLLGAAFLQPTNVSIQNKNVLNTFFKLCGATRYEASMSNGRLWLHDKLKRTRAELLPAGTRIALPVKCVMKIIISTSESINCGDVRNWFADFERETARQNAPEILEPREDTIPF